MTVIVDDTTLQCAFMFFQHHIMFSPKPLVAAPELSVKFSVPNHSQICFWQLNSLMPYSQYTIMA